jgi:hypothetical protein
MVNTIGQKKEKVIARIFILNIGNLLNTKNITKHNKYNQKKQNQSLNKNKLN